MKNLLIAFALLFSTTACCNCGGCSEEVVVNDTVDTVQVDTVSVDSLVIDSIQ